MAFVLSSVGGLAVAGTPAALAAPGDAGALPGRLALDTVEPAVETGQPVHVKGRITLDHLPSTGSSTSSSAGGSGGVTDLRVQLGVGPAITSRGDLARIRDDPASLTTTEPLATAPATGTLTAGGTVRFDLPPVPSDRIRLPDGTRPGGQLAVYPLSVTVTGTIGAGRHDIARASTFLVWDQTKVPVKTGVGVILPLADRPHLAPDGRSLLDDTLAAEVAPTGRLTRLLTAAKAPVALAVDPETVRAINVMARDPYRVGTGTKATVHARDANAKAFLARLRAFARARGQVLALPYGDPDVVALTRAGQLHQVLAAVLRGREVLTPLLGRAPDGTIAYPPDGLADAATLDLLRRSPLNLTTVVLSDKALPPATGLSYTPSAAATVTVGPATVRALVADSDLARVIAQGDAMPAGAARASYFAETALLTAEVPRLARPQIIALPRRWNPSPRWLNTVLSSLKTPWSGAQSLKMIAAPAAAEATGAQPRQRGPLTYSAADRTAEMPQSGLKSTAEVRTQLEALHSVLCPTASTARTPTAGATPASSASASAGPSPSPTTTSGTHTGGSDGTGASGGTAAPPATNTAYCASTGPLAGMTDALLASESAFWRGNPDGATTLRDEVATAAANTRDRIRLVASRSVTLTSKKGRVPVTLENDLNQTVSVRLALSAPDLALLASPRVLPRTLGPRQKAQIEIQVRAETAGSFPVKIALLTPDGKPLSPRPPTQVLVRSTVYGVIATVITVCALGVLALAVVVRSVRRVRAARRARRNPSARGPDGPAEGPAMAAGTQGGGRATGGTA